MLFGLRLLFALFDLFVGVLGSSLCFVFCLLGLLVWLVVAVLLVFVSLLLFLYCCVSFAVYVACIVVLLNCCWLWGW